MSTVSEDSTSLVIDMTIDASIVLSALRGRLTTSLPDLDEDHQYDLQLVVTELVSNVLDHTAGIGRLRVYRSTVRCEITVEVDDTSTVRPVYGRSRLGDTRGRGIVVVDNVSNGWGTRELPHGGKTVYAMLRCSADVSAQFGT
ncbi:ATP-binding protein [Lentzea cavernae]|uniref:ATP-binding protein n=1 Tax=Lentzea cavernae TaxID=2020703 RepID=UPI00174D6C3C|nr:ATP-binding protein [Lentzea cavernae]